MSRGRLAEQVLLIDAIMWLNFLFRAQSFENSSWPAPMEAPPEETLRPDPSSS